LFSPAKLRTYFQLQNNREEKLLAFVLPMWFCVLMLPEEWDYFSLMLAKTA